ncbi:MAG: FTR1 family protein [Tissierellia bacterium]|nr:FTR1 family protein [Tissierellia bacterium]
MTRRRWKSKFFSIVFIVLFLFTSISTVYADKTYEDWEEVAADMAIHLNNAVDIYEAGGDEAGKEATKEINVAYFQFYEKLGFEKTTMSTISGKRGSAVEHQFYRAKRSIKNEAPVEELREEIDVLIEMLTEDAETLDAKRSGGSSESSGGKEKESGAKEVDSALQNFNTFLAVFGLTIREGLEAILVVAAIAAYLTKTNNRKYMKSVYSGALLGIVFSIVLAIIFNVIADKIGASESGIGQEIFEGIAMFVAVAVLFYVSNWMLSKSEVEVWNQYIHDKVEDSITKGNAIALAFTSFLAVAREGAELILFFQGMRSNIANSPYHMWLGLGIAAVLLVVIYIAITKLSVRLPLKPFFIATSWLMFILCISFAGKGVFELQEAGVVGRTIIPQMNGFSLPFFGIYDRVETLLPQAILLLVIIASVIYQNASNRKKRAELEAKHGKKIKED